MARGTELRTKWLPVGAVVFSATADLNRSGGCGAGPVPFVGRAGEAVEDVWAARRLVVDGGVRTHGDGGDWRGEGVPEDDPGRRL